MSENRDVVILGGGPGGSTLATCLKMRDKQRSVLLLERERFPRFHIGESLLPRSMEVFKKIGIEDKLDAHFIRKYGARFLCSETRRVNAYSFSEAFEPVSDYAYQVPRAEFDHLLLKHAAEMGAEVREQWEATEVIFDGPRAVGVRARSVTDPSETMEVRAPVIVDATGRDTLLASRMRRKANVPKLDKTALYTHYKGAFREPGIHEGNIQIIVFEHGWFWVIPFLGELTSVGAVVSSDWIKQRKKGESLDELFDRTVAKSCWASEFLANATRQRPVGALADFSYRIDQLTGDGWLFVGDAGGFLDPLFSTGAHLAVKGADLAADAIGQAFATGDFSRQTFARYESSVRYAVDLFLGVVQAFYAGRFRETLFEQNQRQTMRRLITSILAGDVFHQDKMPKWAPMVRELYPAELPTFG